MWLRLNKLQPIKALCDSRCISTCFNIQQMSHMNDQQLAAPHAHAHIHTQTHTDHYTVLITAVPPCLFGLALFFFLYHLASACFTTKLMSQRASSTETPGWARPAYMIFFSSVCDRVLWCKAWMGKLFYWWATVSSKMWQKGQSRSRWIEGFVYQHNRRKIISWDMFKKQTGFIIILKWTKVLGQKQKMS